MPCFSCTCFREGRGRNGEVLFGGRGYCKLKDQEYYRGHECRSYSPTWYAPKNTKDPMKEPNGCFLTSACVEYLGLPDDCKELTTLRAFRDNVLKATGEGRGLVDEYYRIAPVLVEKINASPKKAEIYREIYERILSCIREIEQENHDTAVVLYREMVQDVERKL